MPTKLSRRAAFKLTAAGLAGIAVGPRVGVFDAFGVATSYATQTSLSLTMRECLVEMVDLTRVYMWSFDSPQAGLRVPGPVIYARDGDPVVIDVTNELPGVHAFAVHGVVDSGPIEPGQTVRVSFPAPAAGTYIYLDPLRAPLHRAMGLAGVLVVLPDGGATPYTDPTSAVGNLFEDLGTAHPFPGHPWIPDRTWIWAFSTADPLAHDRVRRDPDLSPEAFLADYVPTYFMINGKSGFFSAHDRAIAPHGRVGQPALLRSANVGLATHSPHVHGNHVYVVAEGGDPADNVFALDTWRVPPLHTADVVLPFVRPPDAWPWPPSDPSVWTTDLAGDGMAGMVYPMHCHMELSQLANGGNYPQGLITHWVLEGDLVEGPPPTTTTTTTTSTTEPTTTTTTEPITTTTTTTTTPKPGKPEEPGKPDKPGKPGTSRDR